MAWISVHEQVLGSKLRRLGKKIGCSQNEALGVLVRLWLWGINNADKDGMIVGADKTDLEEILNIGIDQRYSSEDVVEALICTDWIDSEKECLFIHDWSEWQKQWYMAMETRQKDAARKRLERERKRQEKQRKEHVSEKSEMERNLNRSNNTNQYEEGEKKKPSNEYSTEFEDFWSVYPKKIGKGEAYRKYKARLNDGWTPDELKEAAQNYARAVAKNRTDKQYIKHPKTFLSDATPFTDFIKKKEINTVKINDDDPYAEWRE